MKRTDLICVSLDVHRYTVERLRAMTPEQRAHLLLQSIERTWGIERSVREQGLRPHGRTSRTA